MAYQWDSFREPGTPDWDRELEREMQWLHQLQMTSPSIRRQREYNHWQPIPQPNFGELSNAPAQGRIDWQQRFEQGFQSQHALWLQNCGRRCLEPNESLPAAAGPSIPVAGPSAPIPGPSHIPIPEPSCMPIAGPSHIPMAGPSAPFQGRVDWQHRLEQGFQARQNQQLQNHGHIPPDQTPGVRIESQWGMAQ